MTRTWARSRRSAWPSNQKGGGQEGALAKTLERQRVQQAAADAIIVAAKKLEDATKCPTVTPDCNRSKPLRHLGMAN